MCVSFRSNTQMIIDKQLGRRPLERISRPPVFDDAIGKEQNSIRKELWSPAQRSQLIKLVESMTNWDEIAQTLERTKCACQNEMSKIRRKERKLRAKMGLV